MTVQKTTQRNPSIHSSSLKASKNTQDERNLKIKYFLLLGFLDGKVGFIYAFLNSFWFHTLSDAKNFELTMIKKNKID